jgi:hypothetical protein
MGGANVPNRIAGHSSESATFTYAAYIKHGRLLSVNSIYASYVKRGSY